MYRRLKAAIVSGQFAPGERLTEERLAEAMHVSRTPVREALHRLEVEEIIEPLGRRGFTVPAPSGSERDELLELRALLEGHAVQVWCGATSTLESIVQETAAKAEAALAEERIAEAMHWNRCFHAALCPPALGRPRLADALAAINGHLLRYRGPLVSPEACGRAIAEHRGILLAVKLGEPDLGERLARQHGHAAGATGCL